VRAVLLLAAGYMLAAAPLLAQRDARLEITLAGDDSQGQEAPVVRSSGVLSDRRMRDLLNHGFPARLHYRVELWSARGLFDDLRSQVEWDVIVRYNPMERLYTATRIEGERATPLGTFGQLRQVEDVVGTPFQPAIRPPTRRQKFYYSAVLDIEMLSVNDLDEVERWLRGELSPAVHGEKSPGTAITRGARILVTRLLGGEQRHYEARSKVFRP
jgi:hypothetical protein